MNNNELQEWSRHFDILLWSMIAFVTAGIVGLLLYSSEHPDLWLCLSGIVATNIGVYLVASFRALRRKINTQLDPEIVEIIRPIKLRQWPILLLVVLLVLVAWIKLLNDIKPDWIYYWVITGIIAFALDVFWVIWADSSPRKKES